MRHSVSRLIFGGIGALSFVSGCALLGSGETTLLRAKSYRVTPPSGWVSLKKPETDRAFRLPSGSIATLTSSCERNPDAPLDVLTRHLVMGMRNVEFQSKDPYTVQALTGQYSRVAATLENQPIHLHLFVFSESACIFDFVLMNRRALTELEEADFKTFIQSLRLEKSKHGND